MYTNFVKFMLISCLAFHIGACAAPTQNRADEKPETVPTEVTKKEGASDVQKLLETAMGDLKGTDNQKVNIFVGEEEETVQEGNYVTVRYRAELLNGSLIRLFGKTGIPKKEDFLISETGGRKKAESQAGVLLAGDEQASMGLGRDIRGMKIGERKRITIGPERAFGLRKKDRIRAYDRIRKYPIEFQMTPQQYYKRFKEFPIQDATVAYTPYVDAKIIGFDKNTASLSLLAQDGHRFEDAFGDVLISIEGGTGVVAITLQPVIGKVFNNGIITSLEETSFSVDYNHPLAGESINLEVTIEGIHKPSSFGNDKLVWVNDYGKALEMAEQNEKPILLMLYADWCEYCRKMMGGTFEDPWVRYFKDRFIWVKVNSDKDRSFFTEFDQKGFPFTVIIGQNGDVLRKLRGYKKAGEIRRALLDVVNLDPGTV